VTEAAVYARLLETLGRLVLAELRTVPDQQLNRVVSLPEANSLFAIATHVLGASRWWVLGFAGGRVVDRDREGEFVARGSIGELERAFEEWFAEMHRLLDDLPAEDLERLTPAPAPYPADEGTSRTVRDCLLHMIEHTGIHLGHVQVTRHLLEPGEARQP
jgi:uncharacterized damage-inducible protein DinB